MEYQQYTLDIQVDNTVTEYDLYSKATAVLKDLQLQFPLNFPIELVVSTRMISTLGKAEIAYKYGKIINACIKLSAHLGDDWEDTLRHEYAHLMADKDRHGKKWVEACLLLGIEPMVCGNMPNENERLKYVYECSCRKHYRATAIKSDVLERTYCKDCKSKLNSLNTDIINKQHSLNIY